MTKYHQGRFRAKNPQKYKGDVNNIIYRSGWELKVLMKFDLHPDVISYSSEEIVIPYISPVDNKKHRYYVDFYVKMKDKDGKIKEYLLEVKPLKQTFPPVKGKKVTKGYINEVMTYAVNQAKWDAARNYCEKKGLEFMIMTEKELGI
jgi:hypothetical protein